MKKIIFSIIAAAAIATGCNREVIEQQGSGSLAIDLSCKSDYNEVETKATDDEIINDLAIDIERPFDGQKYSYTPFSTIRGKVVELGSGAYILTASSQKKADAAFEQPIYLGKKDFTITTGQVTTVDVTCSISNMKVTVNLSANFVKELSDYTVTVSNGRGSLSWNKNAMKDDFKPVAMDGQTYYTGTQAGFFTVAPLTVTIDGHRAIDNTSATITAFIDKEEHIKEANHHLLNIDAHVTGTLGGINITIDHKTNDINQPVIIPGFNETPVPGDDNNGDDNGDDNGGDNGDDNGDDNGGDTPTEPTPSTAPYLVWEANPTFAPMNIDDNLDANLVINAPKKVKAFEVIVDSEVLSPTIAALCSYADSYEDGTPAVMDMIDDAVLLENLGSMGLGLPLGDEIRGKETVPFSLSGLIPLINIYAPEAGAQHKFTLKVTDEEGGVLEQLLIFVSL